jgi:hypothetical protein
MRLKASVAHSFPDVPFVLAAMHQRLRIDGAYARARAVFKAARFRASASLRLVQLRAASRYLTAAFERAALSHGPRCPIEAAQGARLQTQDERNIT